MRFLDALECRPTDRIPFVPAILEHKAWFVNSTPSRVCRDAGLLTRAILREYEQVQADALVVGMDPYNVEAEAAGSRVHYPAGEETSIPSLVPGGEVLREGESVAALPMPRPGTDGRMPLFLEVAESVHRAIGRETVVRGVLSGPFSMAAGVMGTENLLMAVRCDAGLVRELLAYCVRVIADYGKEFLRRGCGVVVYDSHSSPGVISPATYRDLVLEPSRDLVETLRRHGARHVPLIIGGNTAPILEDYLATGANNLLCDFLTPMEQCLQGYRKGGRAFRRNLNPTGFLVDTPAEVHRRAIAEIEAAGRTPGFVLGTGVVPFGTPTEVLAAIREAAGAK